MCKTPCSRCSNGARREATEATATPDAEARDLGAGATGPAREALPCPEALLAGTLALMTSWADPCPNARLEPARLRPLLARKLVSNLALMSQHPAFSAPLRQVLAQAQRRWADLAGGTAPGRAEDAARAAGVLMQGPVGLRVH